MRAENSVRLLEVVVLVGKGGFLFGNIFREDDFQLL